MGKSEAHVAVCREIRQRRMDAGLTIEELAERCGITPNYLGTVERGLRDPSLSTLISLATGLGITVGELFGPKISLGEQGFEIGRLFDQVSPTYQEAVLIILRGVVKKRRE